MGEGKKELLKLRVGGRRWFELAALAAFLDPRNHFATLPLQKIADPLREAGMREEVHAARERGIESSQPFVFPTGARLEARETAVDTMLDAGVVAHVEVQEP